MWRSPGASRRGRALAVGLALLASPAVPAETGAEAFARQDYAAAAALWRDEAAAGSLDARFGLGLLSDLGLGTPRNAPAALRWYLEAAGEGHPDAQFNVAVMFDAGTGVPPDPAVAAAWYGRAAANGHARAQYNLGLLTEAGSGVPRNEGLARAWFAAAAPSLPAAAARLAAPPPAPAEGGPAPRPSVSALLGPAERPRAELVWTAEAGRTAFRVELEGRNVALVRDVEVSALRLDLPAGSQDHRWRVGRLDPAGAVLTWSDWQELGPAVAPGPEARPRLLILTAPGDALARSYADELAAAYGAGGLGVAIGAASGPQAETRVEYGRAADAALAGSVAGFLPGGGVALLVGGPDAPSPGEVRLRLVGGPAL